MADTMGTGHTDRALLRKYLLNLAPDISVFSMIETAYYQNETTRNNILANENFIIFRENQEAGEHTTNFRRAIFKVLDNCGNFNDDSISFPESEYYEIGLPDEYVKYYIVLNDENIRYVITTDDSNNSFNIEGVVF